MRNHIPNDTDCLPRAIDAERYMVTCIVGWPERAPKIVSLVEPRDFFDPLHASLWRAFRTQLERLGEVDQLAAGKQLNCCDYLVELSADTSTTAFAEIKAEAIREAAQARALHEVLQRGADAILRGRLPDSVRAQVNLALGAFETSAVA